MVWVFVQTTAGFPIYNATFNYPFGNYSYSGYPGWYYVYVDNNKVLTVSASGYYTNSGNTGTVPGTPGAYLVVTLQVIPQSGGGGGGDWT